MSDKLTLKQTKIKNKITQKVLQLRKVNSDLKDDKPRFISYDEIVRPTGEVWKRIKIILMSKGCTVPTCTMCPLTNESNYNQKEVYRSNILEQIKLAFSENSIQNIRQLSLYNDGSFFSDKEISANERIEIARLVAQTSIKVFSVESLPQFVTVKNVKGFIKELGQNIKLEIGIGLQSENDIVREICVNTSFSKGKFERAINVMKEFQIIPKVYLLVKPPFLNEEETVTDILNSIKYLADLNVKYVTLCPVRISKNTIVWDLHRNGLYEPLNLWTICHILEVIPDNIQVRVACVNLKQDDFFSISSQSCSKCYNEMVDFLTNYRCKEDLLNIPYCTCYNKKRIIHNVKLDVEKVFTRIENYLK